MLQMRDKLPIYCISRVTFVPMVGHFSNIGNQCWFVVERNGCKIHFRFKLTLVEMHESQIWWKLGGVCHCVISEFSMCTFFFQVHISPPLFLYLLNFFMSYLNTMQNWLYFYCSLKKQLVHYLILVYPWLVNWSMQYVP